MSKILITGGSGFQGSHLTEELLKRGHRLTVLNTWSEEAENNSDKFKNQAKMVWGSVTDKEIVEKTVRGQDVVFHLAARVNVDESIKSPLDFINVNIEGTYNVLEAVKKHNNRLIYASTCEVYGETINREPINESHELRPHSPYAASKAGADRLCYAYFKTYGVKVTIIRPFNIYGERQKEKGFGAVIPIFVNKALNQEPLTVFGSGEQTRDYMNISDLVQAYLLALEQPNLAGETINFGTGQETKIKDIAEYIAKKLGGTVKHEATRPGEVIGFVCDYSKAKKLGWTPKIDIWTGIDRYIDWRKKTALITLK
jgi:dTDP-glucose 4,6-dehydratase